MTQISPIFQKELDAFEKEFPYRTRDTAELQEKREMLDFLLAALKGASMAVVEESVGVEATESDGWDMEQCCPGDDRASGFNKHRIHTLDTAREIIGTNKQ